MAQFQILYPHSDTEWRPITIEFHYAPCGNEQYLWPTFEEAEAARHTLVTRTGDARFRVALAGAEIGDLDWQTREKLRFADDTYAPTPWHDEPWYQARHEEHFCHVSTEQAGKIAFTENPAKGQVDRQLVMSPGRYLHRYFPEHLDNNAIEGWCAKLSVLLQEYALKITQDAEEIEDVYVGGPSSCMAHEAGDFDSFCHPVRVYAGPDTALAYIGPRNDASARSVVWPSRKIYTSMYGDVSRLKLLLEDAGYVEGGLNGARIRRIEDGDDFVVPYIDAGDDLADDGQYLIIGRGGISSHNTNGLANCPWYCPRCDDDTRPHDTVYTVEGDCEEWCYSCFHYHTTYCEYNERHYSDEESFVTVYSDGGGSTTVLENDAEEFGAVYLEDRCEWWATSCCRQCDATGQWFHLDDLTEYEGEWLSEGYVPEPLDDEDPSAANAHVLAYRQAHDGTAAIHANCANNGHATGDHTQDESRDHRDKAEGLSSQPSSDAPRDPEHSLPALAMTPSAPAPALAQTGV